MLGRVMLTNFVYRHAAASYDRLEVLEYLIEQGEYLNWTPNDFE